MNNSYYSQFDLSVFIYLSLNHIIKQLMLGRGGSDQYDCLDTFEVQYFPCLLLGDYCTTQETNHIIDLESSNNCVIL